MPTYFEKSTIFFDTAIWAATMSGSGYRERDACTADLKLIADVAVCEQTNGVCLDHETSVGNSTATKHSE